MRFAGVDRLNEQSPEVPCALVDRSQIWTYSSLPKNSRWLDVVTDPLEFQRVFFCAIHLVVVRSQLIERRDHYEVPLL